MGPQLVIGIDLGTTGCRAVAYSETARPVARHYLEYGLTHPAPGADEQEAEGWWSAARVCLKEVVAQLADAEAVVALGVSAQGHSWVPTEANLRPLRPALTWLDTRAAPMAQELLKERGAHFWGHQAGKTPGAWHALPQILWLRQQEPQSVLAASHYLFAHDFLVARLTGELVTDFTTAAGSLLFNIREFEWDRALGYAYQVDVRRFAPAQPAGAVAGHLRWEAARDLGLPAGIPVAVGAQDQKCAALAAGIQPGVATVSLGTSTAITAITRHATFDEAAAIPCFPYLSRDTWVLEAPLTTTGGALRWLRDFIRGAGAQELSYEQLDDLAAAAPVGSNGVRFLPFLAGAGAPHWDAEARGCVTGLSLDTTPGDVARALLEGVALEIAENVAAMQRQGVPVERLRLFGGGARSDLWARIIASVTGLRVERSTDVEAAAAGAAILALTAAGLCETPTEGQVRFSAPADVVTPRPTPEYTELARDYARVRDAHLESAGAG